MNTWLKVAIEYECNYILHDIVVMMRFLNKQYKQFQLSLENHFQSHNGFEPFINEASNYHCAQ